MNILTEKQIELAVEWWAKAIDNPKFDHGDGSAGGSFVQALAMQNKTEVTEDQLSVFKKSLAATLRKEDKRNGLHSDYGPGRLLAEAMTEAEISHTNSPWKTNMHFREGRVEVSYGYGASIVELHEAPKI